jgi:hypothetical protein
MEYHLDKSEGFGETKIRKPDGKIPFVFLHNNKSPCFFSSGQKPLMKEGVNGE